MNHQQKSLSLIFLFFILISSFTPLFAKFELAEASFEKGIYNFAIVNYLKTINSVDGESSQDQIEKSFYRLAESYLKVDNPDQALKVINDYYQRFSTGQWTLKMNYFESLILVQKKENKLAEEKILKYIDVHKGKDEAAKFSLILAKLYQSQGKREEAKSILANLDEKYQSDINFILAEINFDSKEYNEADKLIEKVNLSEIVFVDKDEVVSLELDILILQKKYGQALALIEENLYKLKKKYYQEKFLFYKGNIFYLQNEFSKSIVYLKNYINEYQDSAFVVDAYYYLALAYDKSKQPILGLEKLELMMNSEFFNDQTSKFKSLVYKLSYEIYKKIGNLEKSNDYLELLLKESSSSTYALEEKLLDLSKAGEPEIEPWLGTYLKTTNQNESLKTKIDFLKKLALNYFDGNKMAMGKKLIDKAYDLSQDPLDYLTLGDMYLSLGRYEEAKKIFFDIDNKLKNQKSKKSKNDYVTDVLGYVYFKNNQFSLSKKYFKQNLKSKNLQYKKNAYFYLAEIRKLEGKYKSAVKSYQAYLKKFPKDVRARDVYYYLASLSYFHLLNKKNAKKVIKSSLGYLEKAVKLFKEVSDKNRVYLLMAQIQIERGSKKAAIRTLNKISKKDPDSYFRALLSIGKINFNLNRISDAITQYYEIINSASTDVKANAEVVSQAYYELFLIKLKQNSAREASFYLFKLKELSPASPLILEGYLALGDYYFSKAKYQSAVDLYQDFIKQSTVPELRSYARFYLGVSFQKLGREQDSYQVFSDLVKQSERDNKLNEFYFDALFESGLYDYNAGEYKKAIGHFKKIINRSKDKILIKKANENIAIIERVVNPDPFKDINDPKKLIQKIKLMKTRNLKEKGYLLLMRQYYQRKEYSKILKWVDKIPARSVSYELAVLWKVRALWRMEDYEQLYEYGLEKYLDEAFNPSVIDREYFYYVLASSSKKLGYDKDGTVFLVELKKFYPNSAYLKELEEEKAEDSESSSDSENGDTK